MPKQKPLRDMFPHQPHDRYARYALGIPKVASDLIRLSDRGENFVVLHQRIS